MKFNGFLLIALSFFGSGIFGAASNSSHADADTPISIMTDLKKYLDRYNEAPEGKLSLQVNLGDIPLIVRAYDAACLALTLALSDTDKSFHEGEKQRALGMLGDMHEVKGVRGVFKKNAQDFIAYCKQAPWESLSFYNKIKASSWVSQNLQEDMQYVDGLLSKQLYTPSEAFASASLAKSRIASLHNVSQSEDRDFILDYVKRRDELSATAENPIFRLFLPTKYKAFSSSKVELEECIRRANDMSRMRQLVFNSLKTAEGKKAFDVALESKFNQTAYSATQGGLGRVVKFDSSCDRMALDAGSFLIAEAKKICITMPRPKWHTELLKGKADNVKRKAQSKANPFFTDAERAAIAAFEEAEKDPNQVDSLGDDSADRGDSAEDNDSLNLLSKILKNNQPKDKSFFYKHPLLTGFSSAALFTLVSVAKSALSYDENNPPVDEEGNVISKRAYVLNRFKKFDPNTIECWLKVGAIATVVAAVGVKMIPAAA